MRNITRTLLASCMATATLTLSAGAIADRGSWNPPGQGWNHHSQSYKHHDRRWDHDRRVIRERVYIHGAPVYYDSRVYYGPPRYGPPRYGPPPYYPRYQSGASVIIHLPPIILR